MLIEPEAESGDPALHAPVLRPGEPEIQTGCGEFAKFKNVPSIAIRHPEDVADDRDRKLGAIPVDDVDDTWFAGQLIQQ